MESSAATRRPRSPENYNNGQITETEQQPNSFLIETLKLTVRFCGAFLSQEMTVTLFIPDALICLVSVRRNHEAHTHTQTCSYPFG